MGLVCHRIGVSCVLATLPSFRNHFVLLLLRAFDVALRVEWKCDRAAPLRAQAWAAHRSTVESTEGCIFRDGVSLNWQACLDERGRLINLVYPGCTKDTSVALSE